MRYAIEARGIKKIYKGATVLQPLDLSIPAGGVYGLLGPNGAGKTTLMKIIAGLVRPEEGELFIFGQNAAERTTTLKRLVGLVPQDNNLEREFTVREALTMYGRLFGVEALSETVEATIARFELEDMQSKTIRSLSGGMMRRVLIARSLMPNPELLLLDEPTVGLDPDVRQGIWDIISSLSAEGKTIIFTTHYMEEAVKLCNRIAIFREGSLVVSETKEKLQQRIGNGADDLEKLFIRLSRGGDL